jgi:hypothetical protein
MSPNGRHPWRARRLALGTSQSAPLDIAELVEHEQRVIAGAAEMPVVDTAFLLTADGAGAQCWRRWSPRYRGTVKRLYFRGDAALANPEIYEFPEAEGMGFYASRSKYGAEQRDLP